MAFEITTKSHRIAKGFWVVLLCFTGPELPPACKMCLNNNDDEHHHQSGVKLRPFEKTVGAENVVGALRLPAEGPFLQSSQGQMSVATCPVSSAQRAEKWAVGMALAELWCPIPRQFGTARLRRSKKIRSVFAVLSCHRALQLKLCNVASGGHKENESQRAEQGTSCE